MHFGVVNIKNVELLKRHLNIKNQWTFGIDDQDWCFLNLLKIWIKVMMLAVMIVCCAGGRHGPAEGTERFQHDAQTSPGKLSNIHLILSWLYIRLKNSFTIVFQPINLLEAMQY